MGAKLAAQILAWAVAVDTVQAALRVWEAEAPDSRLRGPAVGTGMSHRVAGAAICQPASIAAVQATELPGSKELAHLGNLGTIFLAGLPGLLQRQLLGVLQVVHPPWGKVGHECWAAEAVAREDSRASPKNLTTVQAQGTTMLWTSALDIWGA